VGRLDAVLSPRSPFVPPPLAVVYDAPFHLLYIAASAKEYAFCSTRLDPFVSIAHDIIVAGLGDAILLPVSAP
jgi:hypothetical protein